MSDPRPVAVTGLSILGSTGEGPALTVAQRQRALEASLEATNGRGAVFTGAASSIESEVIASLKTAAGTGARGALVPPPYYYRMETDAIVAYFERGVAFLRRYSSCAGDGALAGPCSPAAAFSPAGDGCSRVNQCGYDWTNASVTCV